MHTQQIVRGAAEVLTITTLRINDVYKRVVEANYAGEPTLRYGVVTDLMDNGSDAAVVALEFRPSDYGSGVQIESKIITGDQGLAIFPAQPEEVRDHMAALIDAAQRSEDAALDALTKAQEMVAKVRRTSERVGANLLTAPETSNVPLAAPSEATDAAPAAF